MKITNLKNHRGESLREWDLKEEHQGYFLLQEPGGSAILNIPKSSFEHHKEHAGASRTGDKFYLPEVTTR